MRDPSRLTDDPATSDMLRDLVSSARADVPSADFLARVNAGVTAQLAAAPTARTRRISAFCSPGVRGPWALTPRPARSLSASVS